MTRVALVGAIATMTSQLGACDWSLHRMQDQPRCVSHAATELLPGGACDLVPPEGTVEASEPAASEPPATVPAAYASPLATLERGQDRFTRFCAPCHGDAGDGDSAVATAMALRRPPSLVDATVTGFTDDRIATVVAHGYGAMPGYAGSLALSDRDAILAYLRVLQHRDVAVGELTAAQRREAMRWLR
jgi:mono/diheme cytochrome c family protein